MSAFKARIAGLQARVEGMLDGMSSRDRTLLMGLVVFAALAAVGGGAWSMMGRLDTLEKQVKEARGDQQFIQSEIAEYKAASTELERIQKEMAKYEGQDMSSFMEKAAEAAEIRDRLDSVRENSVVEMGDLEQKNYSVRLTRVSLDQMVKFLYQVEATGYPLQITTAKFKRVKVSGEWMLNVTLEIAAYRLLQEA
ncbi:MAG: type II secretion system protein GspM [Myxococcota bacterium]|nr:type II secretion system protein GspM [Myxococcota bacterium]